MDNARFPACALAAYILEVLGTLLLESRPTVAPARCIYRILAPSTVDTRFDTAILLPLQLRYTFKLFATRQTDTTERQILHILQACVEPSAPLSSRRTVLLLKNAPYIRRPGLLIQSS